MMVLSSINQRRRHCSFVCALLVHIVIQSAAVVFILRLDTTRDKPRIQHAATSLIFPVPVVQAAFGPILLFSRGDGCRSSSREGTSGLLRQQIPVTRTHTRKYSIFFTTPRRRVTDALSMNARHNVGSCSRLFFAHQNNRLQELENAAAESMENVTTTTTTTTTAPVVFSTSLSSMIASSAEQAELVVDDVAERQIFEDEESQKDAAAAAAIPFLSDDTTNSDSGILSNNWIQERIGIEPTPEIMAIVTIYFVEGALGLARLAQTYLLKDELSLGPAELAALTGIFALPWTIKPLYGFLSDGFPLFGYRRKSYLIAAGLLGATSYGVLSMSGFWQGLDTGKFFCDVVQHLLSLLYSSNNETLSWFVTTRLLC
jgi:BT1 family